MELLLAATIVYPTPPPAGADTYALSVFLTVVAIMAAIGCLGALIAFVAWIVKMVWHR